MVLPAVIGLAALAACAPAGTHPVTVTPTKSPTAGPTTMTTTLSTIGVPSVPALSGDEAIADKACPAGEFHENCMFAFRANIGLGVPFAICVWPDGNWATTDPEPSDAVGSPCGTDGNGLTTALFGR